MWRWTKKGEMPESDFVPQLSLGPLVAEEEGPYFFLARDQRPEVRGREWLIEKFGKLQSAIGPGTVVKGKLQFDTHVRIDGKFSGTISAAESLIVIGPTAEIDAEITAAYLAVFGRISGVVRVKHRVEIFTGASLEASVWALQFIVEDGASFNGSCNVEERADNRL